jgi:hypothetical protein
MLETVRTFGALSEEFVELFAQHHPVQASRYGIHDYDSRLPDDSPSGLRERTVWLKDFEQRLAASVPIKELPLEQRVDHAVLGSRIAAMRADLEEIQVYQHNPAIYPLTALEGIFLLMARGFAPLDERKEMVLSRMQAVPDYLKAARANFTQVPDTFLAVAAEVTLSGPGLVDEVARSLIKSFPGETERIEHAAGRARMGFLQYQEFLDRDLEAKVGGTFAIGERWMNYKLGRQHLLSLDCQSLEALGKEHVERTRQQLEAAAKELDASRSWKEQLEEAKKRHFDPLRIRENYQAEVDRARAFVIDKRFVPYPEGERLLVEETPVFERGTNPYAVYLGPAPFGEDQVGQFFVTPVDISRRKEEQEQQLCGHCAPVLPLVTVHETYPGHHLQQCHANRSGSRIRKLANSDVFYEGWALYCEDLMAQQGYFTDPATRLFQLRDLLWRACRVVIDVGLHTGKMTFMQAVDLLVEQASLERVNAVMEVKRYAMTPTQPSCYLVGKIRILELRAETERRLEGRFDLHDFHAALLAGGTIPPNLAAEELRERLP